MNSVNGEVNNFKSISFGDYQIDCCEFCANGRAVCEATWTDSKHKTLASLGCGYLLCQRCHDRIKKLNK